jgi:hypothetical protein
VGTLRTKYIPDGCYGFVSRKLNPQCSTLGDVAFWSQELHSYEWLKLLQKGSWKWALSVLSSHMKAMFLPSGGVQQQHAMLEPESEEYAEAWIWDFPIPTTVRNVLLFFINYPGCHILLQKYRILSHKQPWRTAQQHFLMQWNWWISNLNRSGRQCKNYE